MLPRPGGVNASWQDKHNSQDVENIDTGKLAKAIHLADVKTRAYGNQ